MEESWDKGFCASGGRVRYGGNGADGGKGLEVGLGSKGDGS